jgi:DNA-binding MarR family transcriptional regulator
MELIQGFPPITRKSIGIIFGMSPSSVSDMVRELTTAGLVGEEKMTGGGDAREKPLVLTEHGAEYLMAMKEREAVRYKYLFDGVGPDEWEGLAELLDKIDAAARKQVDEMIFGK